MPLDPRDYKLSMKISPRARHQDDNEGLRSLLVHRLMDGFKAIGRRPVRNEQIVNLYCEGCNTWAPGSKVVPEEWQCERCWRSYRIEFAVYEELEEDPDDKPNGPGLGPEAVR